MWEQRGPQLLKAKMTKHAFKKGGLQQWYHTLANSPISLSHHVRYFTCRHLGLEPLAGCDRKTGAIAALLRCCATVCGNYLVDFIFGILSTPKALLLPHW